MKLKNEKIISLVVFVCIVLIFCIYVFNINNKKIIYDKNKKCSYVDKGKNNKPSKEVIPIDKWIDTPTYDGSNEVTHPKVLYFENGFNGYKYWMVNTPYPGNDIFLENPSIIVSNDGINFTEPEGIKNPISGYPSEYRSDIYYSDPFMLFNKDHFELFYRKTKSVHDGKYIKNGYNYLYYTESADGINWTTPKLIVDNNFKERYMSPSVVKNNDVYKIWYTNYDCKLRYIESTDLSSFSKPVIVNIKNFNKGIWHSEIQYVDNTYHLVFMTRNNYLYYSSSKDGLNFMEPKLIKSSLKELQGSKYYIYKTSYIINDNTIELYIPYRVNGIWKMYYKLYNINDFYNSLE